MYCSPDLSLHPALFHMLRFLMKKRICPQVQGPVWIVSTADFCKGGKQSKEM